jgi:hypothetical protein
VVVPTYFLIGAATAVGTSLASTVVVELAAIEGRGTTSAALAGLGLGRVVGPTTFPPILGSLYVHAGAAAAFGALGLAYALGMIFAFASTSQTPNDARDET